MNALNLYEVAKQQIEKEFQSETQDARQRRQAKLDSLESLRTTLENVIANDSAQDAPQEVETVPSPEQNSIEEDAVPVKSLSQRIKEEVLSFGHNDRIKMPEVHTRLKARYADIEQLNDGNVRSLIATLLKQMSDRSQIHIISRGTGNEPHIYSRVPAPILRNNLFENQPPLSNDEEFGLYDAVRTAIKGFNGKGFTYRDILGVLKKQHPAHITKKREPSVSATLSNMANRGELEKTALFDGKNLYRAIEKEEEEN